MVYLRQYWDLGARSCSFYFKYTQARSLEKIIDTVSWNFIEMGWFSWINIF